MENNVVEIILGCLLVAVGRKVFWLFVGGLGFIVAFKFGSFFFADLPKMTVLTLSIGLGLLGIVIAFFAQWLGVIIAGFLAGGYFIINLIAWREEFNEQLIIPFFIGGAIGAILMMLSFDFIIILLTSMVGATLIMRNVTVPDSTHYLALIVLSLTGVIIQYFIMAER